MLPVSGAVHAMWARKSGYEKVVIFKKLHELVKYAKLVGFKLPSGKHSKYTLGFLKFSGYAFINGRKRKYSFDVRVDFNGKFYYDHNVFIKKEG